MNKLILVALILIVAVALGLLFFGGTVSKNQNMNQNNNLSSNNSISFDIQGMKVEVLKQGTGAEVKNGDNATVHYVGTFTDGTKFDSSVDRGAPFTFKIGAGMVIKGWDLGVNGMKVGEKRKLTIPYQLGYGEAGYGPIPAKSTLIFEVELLGINQ